ncbi:Gfo/Idh/MocA family protein [Emticicia sp. 21SJ11W-3]|uniref:Gfo/Idh/MocA family protein n=1 Tax=Emticicia sp. 21SJ11W-3 TaxID=2916755 RepID=UPI00209F54DE|nr:Gfo/Idh/MocA family oxidoreductase [Emticicia sp. 21SJ11W-3]UTA70338.1 Gfo/Idh/MocA family oxidoreductase [Emticicia sp. 21SJ11W-3]
MNRKEFIRTSALATGALVSRPLITYASQARYKTALIGSGWWGTNIVREAIKSGECQIVAICDVDDKQIKQCLGEIGKLTNDQPKIYKNYQELLQKEKPEIVINATPDHWHALIAIDAMKAGAHVYLEKPIGHTINEGKAIVKTARDTQRICITGFHRRYSPHNVSGQEFLKSGKVGKIKEVRAFVTYGFGQGKMIPDEPTPAGIDWNMWCGPAPLVPYNPAIHPRSWRNHVEFANGTVGDWGPHWFDQILWWTDEIGPKKVFSIATDKFNTNNNNAPESQIVVYDFEDFTCTWEHSTLNGRPTSKSENVGVYFHGTEGTFHMGWMSGWTFYPRDTRKEVIHQNPVLNMPDQQNIDLVFADLLKSIKSKELPFADILKGHRATNMSLLGMAALKAGKSLEWDARKEVFTNDTAANKYLSRQYRNGWVYPKA